MPPSTRSLALQGLATYFFCRRISRWLEITDGVPHECSISDSRKGPDFLCVCVSRPAKVHADTTQKVRIYIPGLGSSIAGIPGFKA